MGLSLFLQKRGENLLKHYNFNGIPAELRNLPQWILWKAEKKGGRYTKIPYQVDGNEARSNDRRTWSTFATAVKFYEETNTDGIGFVFSRQDNYIGIDIDDCVTYTADDTEKENPIINDFAAEVIETLDSYTEYSVSGTGIHIIIKGSLPQSVVGTGRKSTKYGLEIYQYGRFFTMTGYRENSNDIYERTEELAEVFEKYFDDSDLEGRINLAEFEKDEIHLSNDALWEKMFRSKNGDDIRALYNGNLINDDHSSSDLALCNHLAFWTGKSASRMDSMFRESELMRPKWDRIHFTDTGETYGERTIATAIGSTTTTVLDNDKKSSFFLGDNEPSDIDDDDLPQFHKAARFPTDIFPGEIKEYVERASESVNAPEDFTAIGTLAVISAMIGNQAKVQVTSEWTENCIMYAAFIGSPGVRKTPALSKAMMPLNRIQKQLDQEHEQELLEHDKEMAKHEITLGKWLQESKRKGENANFDDKPVEPEPPARKQIKVNDITVETVVEMMEGNSLLMERDEFVGWIKSMNQYKGGGGGERQTYLEFWNGNRVDVNRKGGKHISVENPFITIVGGIQPARLSEVLSDNIDDGFVERILFSYPDEFPVIRLNDVKIPDAIKSAYINACDTLYYRTKSPGNDVEVMKLSPTAFEMFRTYYNALNDEIREPKFNSILEGAWIKLTAYLARFTLILHCVHWACRSPYATRKNEISPEIVGLSIKLVEYYKKHTEKVYKFLAADAEDQRLKRAAEWIIDKMPDKKCTARDIQRANVCGVRKKVEAEQLISDLAKNGYGITEEEKSKNGRTVYTFTLKI